MQWVGQGSGGTYHRFLIRRNDETGVFSRKSTENARKLLCTRDRPVGGFGPERLLLDVAVVISGVATREARAICNLEYRVKCVDGGNALSPRSLKHRDSDRYCILGAEPHDRDLMQFYGSYCSLNRYCTEVQQQVLRKILTRLLPMAHFIT